MKNGTLIAVGAGVVLVGVVLYQFVVAPSMRPSAPPPSIGPAPAPVPLPASAVPPGSVLPPLAPSAPGAPPAPTAPAPVSFTLSRQQTKAPETSVAFNVHARVYLRASLSNLGDSAASNTKVNGRARVGDDYVSIEGKDLYLVDIGMMPARTMFQRDLSFELTMSLPKGNRAQNEGIIFEIAVASTEKTQTLRPVQCTANGCTEI